MASQAISILAKYGIDLDYNDANTILDFLYLMAKNYDKEEKVENSHNLKEKSNIVKLAWTSLKIDVLDFLIEKSKGEYLQLSNIYWSVCNTLGHRLLLTLKKETPKTWCFLK